MKRYGIGSRILAMLLAMTMVLSWIPGSVWAAEGDIVSGDPGIVGGLDTQDTITWPIKIYDYLADGMLFEFSQALDTAIYAHNGGSYGGGQPMPMTGGICGIDYTSVAGYYQVDGDAYSGYSYTTPRYAFENWGNESSYAVSLDTSVEGATEVERSIRQPVKDVDPMCLHLEYNGNQAAETKAYGWISDFAKDDTQYWSKEDLRYLVMVYRTNDQYETNGGHTMKAYWAVSDSAYSSSADISDVSDSLGMGSTGTMVSDDIVVSPSSQWTYVIVDMKSNTTSTYGIAANWDLIEADRIAGVGMGLPLCVEGEAMDISHIAYFSSSEEAEYFGKKCVRFDEDPGEYMGYTIGMTHSVSGGTATSSYAAPTVSKGLDLTKTVSNGGSWNDAAVTRWSSICYLDVQDCTSHGSGGHYYARISNSDTVLDDGHVKYGTTTYNVSDYRYITLVYRTNIASPKVGFWLERDSIHAGKGFNGTVYSDMRVSMPQSVDEWQTLVYDLAQIDNWDPDYSAYFNGGVFDSIGIMFPGFTSSSQYMDIAYVSFDSSASAAHTFATNAKNYLNNFTVSGGTSVTTTLSKSDTVVGNGMWNMGNNQAFSMLYASDGGGWRDDSVAGGENTWTNGYYSYQIGYNYMLQNSNSTVYQIRAQAESLGYPVSESIFLLNSYNSQPSNLYGVNYETDDSGYVIDETKWFDMSQLDLGYTLYSTMTGSGTMTAGLLESSLVSYQGVDGQSHTVLQYKDDTVSYIAALLRDALTIPERDYWGYNYNYVMGTPSPQFGEDVDGDGKLDVAEDLDGDAALDVDEDVNGNGILDPDEDVDADGILDIAEDLDGDGVLDVDEDVNGNGILDEQDLASALRQLLQITFPENVETIQDQSSHGTVGADFGSYAETAQKFTAGSEGENLLIGPFLQCAPYIETVYDAAWYLLHNLFVPGSYNQVQDEYEALVLSRATLSDGTQAYVFDSGFTTVDETSATVYDKEQKLIYQTDVVDKHQYYYMDAYSTALCPFLPIDVEDATGPYAVTGTPYVREDGAEGVGPIGGSYADRNYHYVLAANGQFTYNSEVDQRLELAGDDDMYLFVNGELVLDMGACHSITNVEAVIGDYVNAAYQAMAELEGYEAGMSDEALEELLAAQGITGDAAKNYRRNHRLCLIDGQSYPIDLYYMERHGWGSNLRVVSSFQIGPGEDAVLGSGTCGDQLTWAMHGDGTLEISGTGAMDDWASPEEQPWARFQEQILTVTIPEGATSIGAFAFAWMPQLAEVSIPTTVSEIGTGAFDSCISLTQIQLPEGLESIADSLFYGCSSLTAVTLPETVTTIGVSAFEGCESLLQIDLPEGVTSIGMWSFINCVSLTKIQIPAGVTSVEEGTFAGCAALSEVILPEGLSQIGLMAFDGCTALTHIELPVSLQTVGDSAFGTSGVQTVFYGGSPAQWEQIQIEANNDPLLTAERIYGLDHSHSYESVTNEPTCTVEGSVVYTCTICGDSYTETIPATGHDPDAMGCQFCGPLNYRLYYDDSNTQWGTVYVYFWSEEDTSMTYWPGVLMTDEGNGIFSCVIPSDADYVIFNDQTSGQTMELQIPGGGSMYSNETWVSYCSHTYENDICTDCGYVYRASYQLYYDDAATLWGEVYVYYWNDVTGSGLVSWPGELMTKEAYERFSCVIPGEADHVLFHAASGEGQTPDLTIPGDNYVYSNGAWVPYCEHSFDQGEVIVEPGCATDGQRVFTCTICGGTYTETISATGHDYDSVVTDATCTDAGYTTHTCTVCGDSYMDSDVAALGHDYVTAVTDATCTEDGTTVYTCGICGDSYSETIPATGHSYENGSCTVCGEADPNWVVAPGLTLSYPTLSFEDEIIYNVYYSVADMTSVVEMGLMLLPSYDAEATMDDAIGTVPGYVTNGTVYLVKTEGIAAANMGDTVYFKVYAKLTDGTYAYSEAGGYNAKAYANTVLGGDYSDAMKSLVVAMVDYGAEAQLFFGHNTDALVNASLTEEQKALVDGYDEGMMDAVTAADSAKAGSFVRVSSNFKELYPSVSFDGAFSINYYCTPAITVDDGMTLYYWDAETYDTITEFTVDNATGSMEMTVTDGQYWGCVAGIAAKDMDKTYYVSCVFESEGETVTTGIISYSLGRYCETIAAKDGDAQQVFAQATAVYGYYAKQYFAGDPA